MQKLLILAILIQPLLLRASILDVSKTDFDFESSYKGHSTFWIPVVSFIGPGFFQLDRDQNAAFFTYTGLGVVGLGLTASANITQQDLDEQKELVDFDSSRLKRYILGAKTYEFAGELSLYHSFRSAVVNLQSAGHYQFLVKDETTPELMMAPFEFSHMKKWTTWVPVGLGAGLLAAVVTSKNYKPLAGGNFMFSSALSYEAGVGEELMFRGWIYPMLYENLGGSTWANVIQATLFGAAHISKFNKAPIFQTLFGYYMGWLTKKNQWSMSEAIFIHTWWDVLVFAAAQSYEEKEASIQLPIYVGTF